MRAGLPLARVLLSRSGRNRMLESGGEQTGRFVHVLGQRVRLLEAGEGEPVVLLHGAGGWAEHWREVMAALSASGFRAVACDLPGFGHSEAPEAVQYFHPDDPYYVRFVRELLDVLGLERVSLVGHSLGGAISAVSTLCMPERVTRLVLVAPGGFGAVVPGRLRPLWVMLASRLMPLLPPAVRCGLVPARVVRGIVRSNFHDPDLVPSWLEQEALAFARAGAAWELTRVFGQLLTLRGPRCAVRDAWCPRMRALCCPTLLVWGRQDRTVPFAQADVARTLMPAARLEVIDGAGHMVMLEQQERFMELLMDFLGAPWEQPDAPAVLPPGALAAGPGEILRKIRPQPPPGSRV